MKCYECNNANICLDHIELPSLAGCTSGIPDRKVITNADRIRSMTDEELAEFLATVTSDVICGSSWDYDGWIKELQSEAE